MAPNVTVHFWDANDINGTPILEITDEDTFFKGLTIKPDLYSVGGWELTLARAWGFQLFGSGAVQPEVFVRFIVHAFDDETYYYGGQLDKRNLIVVHRQEIGEEQLVIGGRGPKAYLDRSALGIEQRTGLGFNLDLPNGVWRWNEAASAGRVLDTAVDEDAARSNPSLPDLTVNFSDTNDSDGAPWTNEVTPGNGEYQTPVGSSVLDVLWDLEDSAELFSTVHLGVVGAPQYQLNAFQSFGDDNTGTNPGAGVCIFREGLNIANDSLTVEGVAIRKASHVLVEGKDGVWVTEVRPTWSPGDYVKWDKISYSRSSSEAILHRAGERWLRRQDNGDQQITVEILPGNSDATGYYFPAPNRVLWLGNTITLDTVADGSVHSPLDYNNADALVTGWELSLGPAGDDSTADRMAKSWTVKVNLNHERAGFASSPNQTSAATQSCCPPAMPAPPQTIGDVGYLRAGTFANTTSGAGLGVGYPATVDAGDFLILHYYSEEDLGSPPTISAGWSIVPGSHVNNPVIPGAAGCSAALFYRLADGTESGNVSLGNLPNVGPSKSGRIYAFSGVTGLSAIEGITSQTDIAGSSIDAPNVTASGTGRLAVAFVAKDAGTTGIGPFTGETGGDWVEIEDASSSGSCRMQMQSATLSGSSISGGSVAITGPDDWIALGVALRGTDTSDSDDALPPEDQSDSPYYARSDDPRLGTVYVTDTDGDPVVRADRLVFPDGSLVDQEDGSVLVVFETGSDVAEGVTFQQVQTNQRFPVWGHRGDIGSADSLPENTLESVRQCALKGIQGAEIDVRLSSDGTFYLMHDSTVDRTTDGTGAISGKTDAQIAALNVNGGYGYLSGSYDVPSLESVFNALNPYDFMLSIQLNASSDANAEALAELVVANGWTHRCVIETTTVSEAATIKAVSAALTTMVNGATSGADSSDDVDWLSMEYPTVTSLSVATGKAPQHVKSYISIDDFPADETPIIQDMWDFGVAAYQTDNVDFALAARNTLVYGGDAGEPIADAHIIDATDAHDASAVSIVDTGGYYTGTDVEAALQEVGADLAGGSGGGIGEILIADTHSTPLVFADLVQNEAQDDLVYGDPA